MNLKNSTRSVNSLKKVINLIFAQSISRQYKYEEIEEWVNNGVYLSTMYNNLPDIHKEFVKGYIDGMYYHIDNTCTYIKSDKDKGKIYKVWKNTVCRIDREHDYYKDGNLKVSRYSVYDYFEEE